MNFTKNEHNFINFANYFLLYSTITFYFTFVLTFYSNLW